jgi:transcriptional regulator
VAKTPKSDVLRGTLELLILKVLSHEAMHGWGVSQRIQSLSKGVLEVNQGSLYPALQGLELKGWVTASWAKTENNRRARYYQLTKSGQKALQKQKAHWRHYVDAVEWILDGE